MANGLIQRTSEKWQELNPAQRWMGSGLALALGIAIAIGVYLNRTEWVVLISGADPKNAAAVAARLQELKVPYKPAGDGFTIMVPRTEQYTAKLALAQAGLPKGLGVGMELFDEPKFGATDFDRRVNYLRAQQGELERTLMRIEEVEFASVKLAIPEKSVFVRDQSKVTASVMVQARTGKRLTAEQVRGIVTFVSTSVQGLTAENVSVVDQTGRLLASGGDQMAALDGDRQLAMQADLERRVQSLLEPIFGIGNVIARVNLELNMDASRIETQTIGNATPKQVETTRESSQPKEQAAQAADPASPPVYQGQSGASGPGDTYKTRTVTNYEVSQRKETTMTSPGGIKKVSVGIAINRPDLAVEQIQQIQQVVSSATGALPPNIAVTAMPFTKETMPLPPPENHLRTLAPYLAAAAVLLLLGFALTRRRRPEPEFAFAGMGSTVGSTLDVAVGKAEMRNLATGIASAQVEELPPEMAAPPIPVEPPSPVQKRLESMISASPFGSTGAGQLDPILRQQLNELVEESPEACAEMVRQWLKGGA